MVVGEVCVCARAKGGCRRPPPSHMRASGSRHRHAAPRCPKVLARCQQHSIAGAAVSVTHLVCRACVCVCVCVRACVCVCVRACVREKETEFYYIINVLYVIV